MRLVPILALALAAGLALSPATRATAQTVTDPSQGGRLQPYTPPDGEDPLQLPSPHYSFSSSSARVYAAAFWWFSSHSMAGTTALAPWPWAPLAPFAALWDW